MAFRFPPQAVFHLRQSLERQQELRLQAVNLQVARQRRALEQLDQRIRQVQGQRSEEMQAGTTSAEMHFLSCNEESLRHQRRDAESELTRWQNLRNQQQKAFDEARRARESLEKLREQLSREYKRDAARREQRQLDEVFLLRQAYLKRG